MSSDNDFERTRNVAAVVGAMAAVTSVVITIFALADSIPRKPYVNRDIDRKLYLDGIINDDSECYDLLRMSKESFRKLVVLFREKNLLRDSRNTKVEEQVAEFLHTIGHNVKTRVIKHNFLRSGETTNRYFHIVLKAVLSLYKDLVVEPTTDMETPPIIRCNEVRFWPWFKDCIGAIDGTHIRVKVPEGIHNRFRGKKEKPTQNVLAAVSFDLRFTYVLAGWEGPAHDTRVLEDALTRPNGLKVPEGIEETQQSVKGKSKQEKKNYRWTDKKEKILISFLAECARKGEKKGKTFSKSTFTQATKAVSDAFNDTCTVENVVGRMKTTKAKYAMIKSLKERSGWAWDDELKMINVDKEDAEDFIEDNPYAKGLLNVPIEQYDELSLVCGDDQATGSSGKAIADIKSETVDIEDVSETRGAPQKAKRSRQWEEAFSKLDRLSQQVSRLANAVSNVDQSFCDRVFYEVMNMEGFDTLMLNSAFEYLTENPLAGKQFISKTHELRMNWLTSFEAKE